MSVSSIVKAIKKLESPLTEPPLLTVVIPIRNIGGPRIKNCVRSLELQRLKSFTTIIADYGSTKEKLRELLKTLKSFDCTIYRYRTDDMWSLPIARNIGIRRATGKIIVTLDADLILEPDVLSTVVKQHREIKAPFVVSTVCNLYEDVNLENMSLPRDYEIFEKNCNKRWGIGGLMSAPRKWWHRVRGFDERMKGWGVEDDDMRKRAKYDGRKIRSIQSLKLPHIKVYHQWHPKYSTTYKHKDKWKGTWQENFNIFKKHRGVVIRNNENWGLWS